MLDLAQPVTLIPTILEHLRHGGATDLRAAQDRVWIVGCAPSGVLFEIYAWPERGYYVSRYLPSSEPGRQLGVFPEWTAAVDCALQA